MKFLLFLPLMLLASVGFGQEIVMNDAATSVPCHSLITFFSCDKGTVNIGLRLGKNSGKTKKKSAIECRFFFTTTDDYVIEFKATTNL